MSDSEKSLRPDASSLHEAVDVWHLRLTADRARTDDLSEDERERADRFRIDKPRIQFVAARAQLRRILASYLDVAPASLRFGYAEHGKPSLAHEPSFGVQDLEFNLSHSGDAGLLGITRGVRIGVDVEFEKPLRRFQGIARRFFATDEFAALTTLAETEQPTAFYRAWACKEAYLKAWGTGLTFPSSRFTIRYVDAAPPELFETEMPFGSPSEAAEDWHFRTFPTFAGYAAAICYSGPLRWVRHYAPGTLSRYG